MDVSPKPDLRKVVAGGYCTGCGACAVLDPRIRMGFDSMQRLQANLPSDGGSTRAAAVCPFADGTPNEDEIAEARFTGSDIKQDARIGRHLATYGGWVAEGDFRARASSGGVGTWLQAELLRQGLVDAVLNVEAVEPHPNGTPIFRFAVVKTEEGVRNNARTRYYPVEMSGVMAYIRDNPGRYAVVGVPCFARATRLIAGQDRVIAERLHFVLALVCGHMKSAAFADAIAWQCDIDPGNLTAIDFRVKLNGRPASRYGASVTGLHDGRAVEVCRPMEGLVGADWGQGFFKLKGCDFCDDVLGETADAVVGDAWLPDYNLDHRGANVIVIREPRLLKIIQSATDEGRLHLDPLSADDVAASQAGGLRHRRDGLAYRLWLADRKGDWRPTKRVSARSSHLPPHLQRIYRKRYIISQRSHTAFAKARESGQFQDFLRIMGPLVKGYERDIKPSLVRRLFNRLHHGLLRVFNKLGLNRFA